MAVAVVTDYDKKRLRMFNNSYDDGIKFLTQALDIDERYSSPEKKKEALKLYNKAIEEFQKGLRSVPKAVPVGQGQELEKKIQAMKTHTTAAQDRYRVIYDMVFPRQNSVDSVSNSVLMPSSVQPSTSAKKTGLAALFSSQAEQEILGCIIDSTAVKLADIVGNDAAKQALDESVILPTLNPGLFSGLRAPVKGILLFGPPGNGKTMLAKAVASEARCTFFSISAATIMSKWVGEGEKMVRELFRIARAKQPSIIFIDEIDSMLSARGEEENGASRRVKTEFLLQFDGASSSPDDRVLVLGATNRPFDLDDGILRRFPRRIFIDLPNALARERAILKNFEYSKTSHRLNTSQLRIIAERTNGYSYSDLTALCKEAAMGPIRGLNRSQLEKLSSRNVRPVQYEDVAKALEIIKPSSSSKNHAKLLEFAENFAQLQA
uniref:AAA+ ATPase domain-containing protein n=1 Tax=Panagrolaimus sp. JU765 TaxID=591449 RepID=A0AC34QI04_9BILA